MKTKLIDKYFSPEDLTKISQACHEVEQQTAGEIRVCIYNSRPFGLRHKSVKTVALTEFYRLGMHKTRDKTGILLLILLKERRFHIIADQGIHSRVSQSTWDELAGELSEAFKQGAYLAGILQTVQKMGAILASHFPRKPDDTNELPDEIVVR